MQVTSESAVTNTTAAAVPVERLFEFFEGGDGENLAWWQEGRSYSRAEMHRWGIQLASALSDVGLARGDRIALWLPNAPSWFVVATACSRLGVAALLLNPRLGAKEVGELIARSGCVAVVLDAAERGGACVEALRVIPVEQRRTLRNVIVAHDEPGTAVLDGVAQHGLEALMERPGQLIEDGRADDVLFMLSTSGTTSRPKLVMHAQVRVCRHAHDVAALAGMTEPGSSMLLAVPLCGGYGLAIAICTLAEHRPLLVMPQFEPTRAAALLRDHRVTHMLGTNDMLDKMLDAAPAGRAFPDLRMFGHANFVPSLTELPRKAESRGVMIRGFFGMTELLAGFAAQPEDLPLARRAEGGGRPASAPASFVIRSPETGRDLVDGEVGELLVKTPNIMVGYLDDPASTAAAFTADGFFRTGDLALRTSDGMFEFVSRLNDVLRIGGYLVSPAEIEEVVAALPGVHICQVVAVARPQGMRPVAFVVRNGRESIDEAAVLQACRERLAIYKVPIRVFTIDEIPMITGANGSKVKRSELRDMALAMLDAKEVNP